MSAKVQHFISKYIRSVWQLELLLLLKGSNKALNPLEIAGLLYISKDSIEAALNTFAQNGLVKLTDGGYVYSPKDAEMQEALLQTSKAYTERRSSVINLIFSGPRKSLDA